MELRHLRYFVRVAEEKHFGRAAQLLNIAQPPLSRQIKDLEDELGVRLLDRSRAGVALTPAGRVFLKEARDVLARAVFAVDQAKRAAKGVAGELRVGHLAGPGAAVIPQAMAAFRESNPGVSLVLTEMNGSEIPVALRDGEIDAAFISEPDDNGPYAGMPYTPVVRYPTMIGLSDGHRLAKLPVVPWKELAGEKFWMYTRKVAPDYRGWITGICRDHGFEPLIAGEVASSTGMLTSISSGVGIAFLLPPYGCWAPPNVLLKPLTPGIAESEFGLVRPEATEGPLINAWLAALAKASKLTEGIRGENPERGARKPATAAPEKKPVAKAKKLATTKR